MLFSCWCACKRFREGREWVFKTAGVKVFGDDLRESQTDRQTNRQTDRQVTRCSHMWSQYISWWLLGSFFPQNILSVPWPRTVSSVRLFFPLQNKEAVGWVLNTREKGQVPRWRTFVKVLVSVCLMFSLVLWEHLGCLPQGMPTATRQCRFSYLLSINYQGVYIILSDDRKVKLYTAYNID